MPVAARQHVRNWRPVVLVLVGNPNTRLPMIAFAHWLESRRGFLFLAQIAFIVAFGVLLDTLVVRSLLVPSLCYLAGGRTWWPSALGREAPRTSA